MKKRVNVVIVMIMSIIVATSCGVFGPDKMSGRIGLKYDANATEQGDSLEYDLLIIDHGFDSWFIKNGHMKSLHSNGHLQSMNSIYASTWNRMYMTGDRRVESYLDYDSRVDYGFEFNYKLFMYFKYFEEVNRIDLKTGMRR